MALLSFVVGLYHIIYVQVFSLSFDCLFIKLLFPLHCAKADAHFFGEVAAFDEGLVPSEWINWKLVLVCVFALLHLIADTLAYLRPLLMILSIARFQGLVVCLEMLALLLDHGQLLAKLDALVLFLGDILVQLINPRHQLINFSIQCFFLILVFLLHFEYFDINHFIFLYLRNEFLLCQGKILVYLLKLLFHLRHLLRIVAGEEASAKVS